MLRRAFVTIACAAAAAASPAINRTIPDKVILGYTNGACGSTLTSTVRDGVNVLMWSFINLGPGLAITERLDAGCVARTVAALKSAALPTLHIVSIGGWDAPHPDTTAGDGAAWFGAWEKWNKAIPGFPQGFDGFDWDLEGNDDPKSPSNTFDKPVLELVGTMSQAAKKAGYLVTMAPPQSYFDVTTARFDLSLCNNDPNYHPDFAYFGHNVYAYLVAKYGVDTFDLISVQLYESWSKANAAVYGASPPVTAAKYLEDWVTALAAGWVVDFSWVPSLGLNSTKVVVEPSRLVVGLANAWAGTIAGPGKGKAVLFWPDELETAWSALTKSKLQPRGFMYWDIADEGVIPAGATGARAAPLFLARSLNSFVHTRAPPPPPTPAPPTPPTPPMPPSTNFCGTTYADAVGRCHATCDGTDASCSTSFAGEKCFAIGQSCTPKPPTMPPTPTPPVPTPGPPGPSPSAHGSYVVQKDDGCYNIALALCGDGDNYVQEICNAAKVCPHLSVGESIKYDCSKKQEFC